MPGYSEETERDLAPQLSCSFCGKSAAEVRYIVQGPGVYICDECVSFCVEFLRDEGVEVGVIIDTGTEGKVK